MKPAPNLESNSVIPFKKFSFIGKIFYGLKIGGRVYQTLLAGAGILVIAGGVFFSLKLYENRQHKVFAASSAYQVELPKGIDKKDLQNLTGEQKEKLDNQIDKVLNAKAQKAELPEESHQVVVVVLTQNGQPILPDLGKKEEPSPAPTKQPASREEPTSTPMPSPTPPPPCTDTDGGKDIFTKGTLTTSYGDTKTDFCTDPDIIGEYYCVPDASFAFGGFLCPGNCSNGACLQVTPTPTPSQRPTVVPSPTITPTPTNVPCTDSDGGVNIFTKGTVFTWGTNYNDICYSNNTKVFEYSCQPFGYQGDLFACQYGCKDSACLRNPPTPTLTPTPTRVLTSSPTQGPTVALTPTPSAELCFDSDGGKDIYTKGYTMPVDSPGGIVMNDVCKQSGQAVQEGWCEPGQRAIHLGDFTCQYGCIDGACRKEPPENQLTFVYQGDIEQRYKLATGRELKADIALIYPRVKTYFGAPFANITVTVKSGPSEPANNLSSYYNASTNEMILRDYDLHYLALIKKIILAFQDDIVYYIPQNWELAMWNIMIERFRDLYKPDSVGRLLAPLYEINGLSPALASKDGRSWYPNLDPYQSYAGYMAYDVLYKLFLEDPQFFAKFNASLYKQTVDANLKNKLATVAAGVKPTVEGIPFTDWFSLQYVLHVNHIPGKYIVPLIYTDQINGESTEMYINMNAVEVLADGSHQVKENIHFTIYAFTHDNFQVWKKEGITDSQGNVSFGRMPQGGQSWSTEVPHGYSGAMRFEVKTDNFVSSYTFYFPYSSGMPEIPGRCTNPEAGIYPGVLGVIINRTQGRLTFKSGSRTANASLNKGAFAFFEGHGAEGTFSLTYKQNENDPGVTKLITKGFGDYYTSIRMMGAASSSRGVPVGPGTGCTEGWQDYENEDFQLKFKIPSGWTDDSIDERQTDSLLDRHLISTTTPEQQLDPKYKISNFDILASTSDLKDSDYGTWLENNTGNQQKSQIDFKGIAAEKYTDDTQMPCASQTEEGVACNYHSEIYYFEKDDIYYLLSLGIYTTPDLKEKNEATLKCFLDNFELPGQEEIVGGMKLFISQRLQFKIRYPAELFAYEWKSSYQPDFNKEKPDWDRNIVQFFKNKDLYGGKITIQRNTNSQRKTAKDFAKAYWSASEEKLKHWKPKDIDFVVYSVKVQGSNEEEKTYFTPLGDWMYIFDGSDAEMQSALEKMLPTLEFLGSGEGFSEDLIPCPDDLYSTAEELKEQQEDWWAKPDPCDSRPEQKVCGYIRSIYDNGVIQVGSSDYRNLYCYCSFFEKNGSRVYRGTEMFSLGYKEGACVK